MGGLKLPNPAAPGDFARGPFGIPRHLVECLGLPPRRRDLHEIALRSVCLPAMHAGFGNMQTVNVEAPGAGGRR